MTKKYRVFVPGAWDLFHIGHVRLLKRAKEFADTLIVGIDSDVSIEKRKGRPPVVNLENRASILDAISYVDKIHIGHENGVINPELLKELEIDILVLGSDWCGKPMPGLDEAKRFVMVLYFPYTEGISTTEIMKKVQEKHK
jgi:rfaE bifunctional protein nucleotidyltransferase chain/domain